MEICCATSGTNPLRALFGMLSRPGTWFSPSHSENFENCQPSSLLGITQRWALAYKSSHQDSIGAPPRANVRLRAELLNALPLVPLDDQFKSCAGFLKGRLFRPDRSRLPPSEPFVGCSGRLIVSFGPLRYSLCFSTRGLNKRLWTSSPSFEKEGGGRYFTKSR